MGVTRRYDLDWLRVSGVFLVVIFHTMMIFILEPWAVVYIKDTEYIHCFKEISNFIHIFNMPLMFVIAGMSVKISLGSRTGGQFIKERVFKLLIPAVFGCIILNPAMTYLYKTSLQGENSFIEYYIGFFTKNPGDLSGLEGGFTPAHFWFVLFLFVFSVAALPIVSWMEKREYGHDREWIREVLSKPFALLIFVLPVAIAAATNILDDKNPLSYFLMFFLGYFIMREDRYRIAMNRDKGGYLIIGIVCAGISIMFGSTFSWWTVPWIIVSLAMQAARIAMVFALLGIGNCYFNRNSKALQYLSKASFPIYMIHLLINTAVGYVVVLLPIPAIQKFCLIVILTLCLSFVFYEIIKRTRVFGILFGMKQINK